MTCRVRPSPNIVSLKATLLYPSNFFEGTTLHEGKVYTPSFCFGHPKVYRRDTHGFACKHGWRKTPKLQDQKCNGYNLSSLSIEEIRSWKRINAKCHDRCTRSWKLRIRSSFLIILSTSLVGTKIYRGRWSKQKTEDETGLVGKMISIAISWWGKNM